MRLIPPFLAALTLSATLAVQAGPVASYRFDASGFTGGGAVTGSFTGRFTPSGLGFPFSAGTGHIVQADVSAFGATLVGNATLPDVSWDLSELLELRLVEPQPDAPADTPIALELEAFDLDTETQLIVRIAASAEIAAGLFEPTDFYGARLKDSAADDDRRFADTVSVAFVGLGDPGTPGGTVPEPGSVALVLAALLLAALAARPGRPRLRATTAAAVLALGSAGPALAADTEPAAPPAAERLAPARTLIAQERWAAAIEALRRLDDTGSADWHNLLGYSLRKARTPDLAAAQRHYDEALRIDPQHRGALAYSGELMLTRGDLPGALARLETLARVCGPACPEHRALAQAIAQHRSAGAAAGPRP